MIYSALDDFANSVHGAGYRVVHVAGPGETPDVVARDTSGNVLNIEVTLTEDRPGDITAALGRSNHKSVEALRAHLEAVRQGKEQLQVNCLQGNVLQILRERIDKKLVKRYGANVALVIRETSLSWDWELVLPSLEAYLGKKQVPFDRGIWLLSRAKDRLTCVVGKAD